MRESGEEMKIVQWYSQHAILAAADGLELAAAGSYCNFESCWSEKLCVGPPACGNPGRSDVLFLSVVWNRQKTQADIQDIIWMGEQACDVYMNNHLD